MVDALFHRVVQYGQCVSAVLVAGADLANVPVEQGRVEPRVCMNPGIEAGLQGDVVRGDDGAGLDRVVARRRARDRSLVHDDEVGAERALAGTGHECEGQVGQAIVPVAATDIAVHTGEPDFRDPLRVVGIGVDQRRRERHPILVDGNDVHCALHPLVQRALFDDHVARDQAAHGGDGVENAEKGDRPALVRFQQDGCELARQRGATAEAEQRDLVARLVGGSQVRFGLVEDLLDIAEGRCQG